jgi:hypothetical protein
MRKSMCMNDFMEVQYGLQCLYRAYHSEAGVEKPNSKIFVSDIPLRQ